MNLALIGLRGTGKTAVSRLLAKKLNKKFISTDREIESKIKVSIPKFIKKFGLERFREVESEIIEKISGFDECVFDTGSDVIMRNENIINLKKSSLVILLTADTKAIASRLKSGKAMPALAKRNRIGESEDTAHEREQRYKKAADYSIDTSRLTPEEICDLITHYIQMEMK